ncbi:MAG TPA: serine protein kinase PrkA, partial [Polyangiaceae bacterium]
DTLEDEFRVASGLVDEMRYADLFDRYVTHVSYWVKREKLRNPMTGQYEDPSQQLMEEVEDLLGAPDNREQLRHSLISTIAAWAIDHPDEPVVNSKVFADHIRRMRNAVFEERRTALAKLCRDLVIVLRESGKGLSDAQTRAARVLLDGLMTRYGYTEDSAGDAAASLLRERFRDLLN